MYHLELRCRQLRSASLYSEFRLRFRCWLQDWVADGTIYSDVLSSRTRGITKLQCAARNRTATGTRVHISQIPGTASPSRLNTIVPSDITNVEPAAVILNGAMLVFVEALLDILTCPGHAECRGRGLTLSFPAITTDPPEILRVPRLVGSSLLAFANAKCPRRNLHDAW